MDKINHTKLAKSGQKGLCTSTTTSEKKLSDPSCFNPRISPLIIPATSIRYKLSFAILCQLMLLLFVVSLFTGNYAMAASRKFLRGFIMGAMFAHHYPHL